MSTRSVWQTITAIFHNEDKGYYVGLEGVEYLTDLVDMSPEEVRAYLDNNIENNASGRMSGNHGTIGNPNIPVGKQQG